MNLQVLSLLVEFISIFVSYVEHQTKYPYLVLHLIMRRAVFINISLKKYTEFPRSLKLLSCVNFITDLFLNSCKIFHKNPLTLTWICFFISHSTFYLKILKQFQLFYWWCLWFINSWILSVCFMEIRLPLLEITCNVR